MSLFGNLVAKLYDNDPEVQEDAIVGLVTLASQHENRWEVPDFEDALAGIVKFLFKDDWPTLQAYAAWAVGNLSCAHAPPDNKQKMALFPQVLPGLVRLLSQQNVQQSSAQEEAARALRNLACAQENNRRISLFPNAFPALLKLLFDRDSSPGVQIQATMAVLNLIGNAMASREGIGVNQDHSLGKGGEQISDDLPDALECLVMLWFSDATEKVQTQARLAITDLVERTLVNPHPSEDGTECGNTRQIADFPDALLQLLRSLFVQDHPAPHKLRRLNKKS